MSRLHLKKSKKSNRCEGCDGRGTVFVETLGRSITGSETVNQRDTCRMCGGTGKQPKEPRI